MRRPSPQALPVCLTVAGSDSGGGAGIQADLKSMEAAGVFGTSVLTAVTAQNTQGVTRSHVLPTREIEAQLRAVLSDFEVGAVKTGMLATAEIIELVTDRFMAHTFPLVVDPVMIAASGDRLLDADAEAAYGPLLELATLVTPNVDEAAVLTGIDIEDASDAARAGEELVTMGAGAALVKGGHLEGEGVMDVLTTPEGTRRFEHPRIDTASTHGSGCTLASLTAARLAHGDALEDAVARSLNAMQRAVRYPIDVGEGPGSVHHLVGLRNDAAIPDVLEAVRSVVDALVARNVSELVPEVGMNVVGTTPYAETVGDTAAVAGRITRTPSGMRPNAGIAIGASDHVARFVLAVRELDPRIRFAVNCRLDEDIETALDSLDWQTASYDREDEPQVVGAREGSTMAWGARVALSGRDRAPTAVLDRGAHGKEPILKLLASEEHGICQRIFELHEALSP